MYGWCKIQFECFPAFIRHRKSSDSFKMTDEKTENVSSEKILLPDIVLSSDNKLYTNSISLYTINGADKFVDFVNEPVPPRVLSLIVENNEFLITNPLELTEMINYSSLTPSTKTKPEFILNSENMDSVIKKFDAEKITNNSILSTPAILEEENDVSTKVSVDSSLINIEPEINGVNEININENVDINIRDKIILELQYGNDNSSKTDKTDRIKTKLPCSYCGKLFEKPFNLQQHERVHTGERPFQCVICGRAFSQKANVRKHMIRHKVWPHAKQTLKVTSTHDQKNSSDKEVIDRTSYSCQYCSSSFSSYSLHKKHLAVHSNFKVYRCIQKGCEETFGDLDEFLCHSEGHSSAEFQCHVCLKVFKKLDELGAHQYDHDLPNRIKKDFNVKLKCKICHAQFKSAGSLKNHLAVDSHNYQCPHCKSVFSCERFLRRHLATHSDPSQAKFECEFCKKTFRTQKYLNNHSFIHSKDKPFNCELCSKQFASKYRLKRHLAIHLSQYLECPFKTHLGCDKKFYRKDKLRNHITTHCRFKVRNCHVCSKTFSSFTKLQQHMKREHQVLKKKQILKCIRCSQTFRKQKQLLQHHCTVVDRNFKSRTRNDIAVKKVENEVNINKSRAVSNIEIIMVPYIPDHVNSNMS